MSKVYKFTNISHLTQKTKTGHPSPTTIHIDDQTMIPPKQFAILKADQLKQPILAMTVGSSPLAKLEEFDDPMKVREELDRQSRANDTAMALRQPEKINVRTTEGPIDTSSPMQEEQAIAEALSEGVKDPFTVVAKKDTTVIPEAFRSDSGGQSILDLS